MNDEEHKKLCAARMVWKRGNSKTPSGVTWVDWFEQMYGEPFHKYVDRIRKKDPS